MFSAKWRFQAAKKHLSEVVRRARFDGPQLITMNGVEVAVVISVDDFARLSKRKNDLVDFFRNSPLVGVELDLERRYDNAVDQD